MRNEPAGRSTSGAIPHNFRNEVPTAIWLPRVLVVPLMLAQMPSWAGTPWEDYLVVPSASNARAVTRAVYSVDTVRFPAVVVGQR
jgi:hypothetical protein